MPTFLKSELLTAAGCPALTAGYTEADRKECTK